MHDVVHGVVGVSISDVSGGARQYRHPCECAVEAGVAAERHINRRIRMHSQVSGRNAEYFITEKRVDTEEYDEADLRQLLERAGTVLVCNACGDVKTLGGDGS